jgi:hypothetical protein
MTAKEPGRKSAKRVPKKTILEELFYPLPGEKNKAREAVAVCKRNALDRGENDGIAAGLALRQLTAAARRTHLAAIASGVKP